VAGAESPRADVRVTGGEHPVTAGVDWSTAAAGMAVASASPGEGWTTLVAAGGRPVVAVRGGGGGDDSGAARQVWVGFESAAMARSPAFVVFWTNVLDWAGGGGAAGAARFASVPLADVPAGARRVDGEALPADVDAARWPGLFETAGGRLAADAPALAPNGGGGAAGAASDWAAALGRLRVGGGAGVGLAPWLALAALACVAGAAATWERRRRPIAAAATAVGRRAEHLDVETERHVETVFAADGHVHRHETAVGPEPSSRAS
jgi:hypothetical protein